MYSLMTLWTSSSREHNSPRLHPDDEGAQGYPKLMRAKGLDHPLPLWGQTLSIAEDGGVLWPGPDGRFHPLTGPGGWKLRRDRSERKRRERNE